MDLNSSNPSHFGFRPSETALPLLIFVSAFFLCAVHTWQVPSLWLDELFSVWVSNRTPLEAAHAATEYHVQSPVYFVFLSMWISLVGVSEFALRLPSLAAVALTAALLFVFCRRILPASFSVAAACLFVTMDPVLIQSISARPYACGLLFWMIGAVLACKYNEADSGSAVLGWGSLYVVSALFVISFQFLFAPSLAVQFLLLFGFSVRPPRFVRFAVAGAFVGTLSIWLFWDQLQRLAARTGGLQIAPPLTWTSACELLLPRAALFVVLFSVALGIIKQHGHLSAGRPAHRREVLFSLLCWTFLGTAVACVSAVTGGPNLTVARYLCWAYLGLAVLLLYLSRLIINDVGQKTFLIALSFFCLFREVTRSIQVEDWKGAVAVVEKLHQQYPAAPILLYSGLIESQGIERSADYDLEAKGDRSSQVLLLPLTAYGGTAPLIAAPPSLTDKRFENYFHTIVEPQLRGQQKVVVTCFDHHVGTEIKTTCPLAVDGVRSMMGSKTGRDLSVVPHQLGLVQVLLVERAVTAVPKAH